MSLLKRTAECAEACGTCSFQFLVILSDISDISMLRIRTAHSQDPAGHSPPGGVLCVRQCGILSFFV